MNTRAIYILKKKPEQDIKGDEMASILINTLV